MSADPSQCADLHQLLRARHIYRFPPPFEYLPLNGVYFVFERGQRTHPHGRSSFRWDLGAAILKAKLPGFEGIPEDVWAHCDIVARKAPHEDQWLEPLDRFET